MKKFQFISCVTITSIALLLGCDSQTPSTTEGDSTASGEHVHADGTVHKDHSEEGHTHGAGPHGGTIVDWGGGKFHVEFTVDHDKQEATVYILGDDEKTPTPIDAEEITLAIKDPSFQLVLEASPQEDDGEGTASRFIGNHENLGILTEYEGSMSGVVDGTPYSGNFKEVAHDH